MLKNLENWLAKNKVTPENKGEVSPQKSVSKTDGRHSPKKPFNKKRAGAPSRPQRPMPRAGAGLRIFALGGMEGVGEKNMFVIEYQRKILIIDMGWAFPDDTLPGIDYIIPDITALRGRERDIVGVVFTHGHMDHIGAIPFLLPQLQYPQLFATKFTGEVIRDRLQRDFTDVFHHAKINTIDPERPLKLGPFTLDFFRVAHNIPDAVGMAISTPAGTILHTGDFKLDFGGMRRVGASTFHSLGDATGCNDVIVLDENGATEGIAVIVPAPNTNGVTFQSAQSWCGLTGIGQAGGASGGDLIDKGTRECCDPCQSLNEVQGDTFGGKNAVMTASYGVESRGTFTKSDVIVSDEEIDFPEVLNPDVVLCLAQVSYDRYRHVEDPCILVYDSDSVDPGEGGEGHLGFPILSLAVELGARESVNIIAMGIVVGIAAPVEPEWLVRLFDRKYAERPELCAKMKRLFEEGLRLGCQAP